jgi:hypothetical protein
MVQLRQKKLVKTAPASLVAFLVRWRLKWRSASSMAISAMQRAQK